ncbi:metal-dependent transcriptional regulator [Anaerolineales bacterium HSG6]|nr:metal-dependent transcriptional regulator [Anaerolineales bacterium HSG6]MDM8530518.1 metal-dependent transcriptional regulator [Anaerolineales bacterium HSG25]
MISQAMEDYLKAIYKLQQTIKPVPTSALAEHMGFSPASVTNMCKKLAELNLLHYEPYQGVVFTEAGLQVALEIIRHHRLIELYLSKALNVPWDQVHAEAEKLEHVISEDLEDRMAEMLGDPQFDPHGAPIPSRNGTIFRPESESLIDMKAGNRFVVVEVNDDDSELLRYLGTIGLYPGTELLLVERAPFDGPLTLKVAGKQHNLGYQAAKSVRVAPVETSQEPS